MRFIAGLAFAILAALAFPVLGQTTPSITLVGPAAGQVVDSTFTVTVRVESSYEITQVTAQVGSVSVSLAPTSICQYPYYCVPGWSAVLDISSLTRGPYSLVVTATDALGHSATLTSSIFYDRSPIVQVTAPTPLDVARPEIVLKATCSDDAPGGCVSLEASVDGAVLASGRASLDTIVSLAAYDGFQKDLVVAGTDSAGRTARVTIPVFVEASSFLEQKEKVPGEIEDVDSLRISHVDRDSGSLYLRNRGTSTDTLIYSNATSKPFLSFLTESGVAFLVQDAASPYQRLKSLESGTLLDLGGVNGDFKAKGRYAMWTNGSGGFFDLFRRDVVAGSTLTIASNVANLYNDVAPNGAVSFWNTSYDVALYRPDGSTTFLTADPDSAFWNIYPRTDGDSVVYIKTTPCCDGGTRRLFLHRAGMTTELVSNLTVDRYRISNGWIAFNRPGPSGANQVWRMDTSSTQSQLTVASAASSLDELGSGGFVTLLRGSRRFLVPDSTANIEIGSALGKTFFVENAPYIAIGRTLFLVIGTMFRPSPSTLFFAGQLANTTSASQTVTLANERSYSITISSAVATSNFSVTSNGCGVVPVGGTCQIGVAFSPTSRGAVTGTLTIYASGFQGGYQVVPLTGIGTEAQTIAFGPAPIISVGGSGLVSATGGASGNPVVFSSQTANVCSVTPAGAVAGLSPGTCTVAANQAGNTDYQAAATATQSFTIQAASRSSPARLFNVSTRARVLTGNDVMIAGFIIQGSANKSVVINVAGPSLANGGVANPLANPTLTLVRSSNQAIIASNDDWQDASNASQILASGFAPNNPREPAILASLAPGAYTAIVQGLGGGTGIGLVGVFEVDHPEIPFANISTRANVGTGDEVVIAGFIVDGNSQTVVVNVAGPSLASAGIANPLANPTLTLVRSSDGAIIATNDDWQSASNAAQIQASGFAPSNSLEPAILMTLPPGAYTAIVQGVGGTSGTALVGVFAVQ